EKVLGKSADNLTSADYYKIESAILKQGWVAFNEGTNIGIFGGGINPEQWKAIASELVDIKKHPELGSKPIYIAKMKDLTDLSGPFITVPMQQNAGSIKKALEDAGFMKPEVSVPEGWRELSPSARERFGPLVEGMAFRDDVADALDRYVQKAFDPEHIDEFWRM